MNKTRILKKIDTLPDYNSKLEYLNSLYLKATNLSQEQMILGLLKQLKHWGK